MTPDTTPKAPQGPGIASTAAVGNHSALTGPAPASKVSAAKPDREQDQRGPDDEPEEADAADA